MEILPPSSTCIACLNPSPIFPILFVSGILQSLNTISVVSLARIPSLFSFFPADNPAVPRSTINAVELFFALGSPVRQITTATSLLFPCVIQLLVPPMIQSFPSLTAVHFILPSSLPVVGSDNPHAPIYSQVASFGRYLFFCSSLANERICPVHKELWAATDSPIEPHTFDICWMISLYSK